MLWTYCTVRTVDAAGPLIGRADTTPMKTHVGTDTNRNLGVDVHVLCSPLGCFDRDEQLLRTLSISNVTGTAIGLQWCGHGASRVSPCNYRKMRRNTNR